MCHPLAGGKGGTQYQRGGRDLRFERADYQTAEFCYPLSAVRFPRERRQSDVRLAWYLEMYSLLTASHIKVGDFSTPLRCARNDRGGEFRQSDVRRDLSDLSSGLHPAPFRSGTKEGAQNFLCPLEGNAAKQQRVYEVNHVNETLLLFHAARRLARLGNSMQNCHLRKGPDVTCFAAASYAVGCVEVGDFSTLLRCARNDRFARVSDFGFEGSSILQKCGMPHFCKMEMNIG